MKPKKTLSKPMYHLLLVQNLDDFTIVQARNALLAQGDRFRDLNEARKYLYRQIYRLLGKGYLHADGEGREKRYSKTPLFHTVTFEMKSEQRGAPYSEPVDLDGENSENNDYSLLLHERNQYQGELAISLAEVDEYKALMKRLPTRKATLESLLDEARKRAALLLGKVNAISALLLTFEHGA